MVSSQLGMRRMCATCERPFYDLNRSPGVCPKCGTEFVNLRAKSGSRGRRPKLTPVPKPPTEEIEADSDAGAGVPLLEVDDDEVPAKADVGE
jgi:uncharacterized protein (TIGR02300 family)